MSQPPSNSADRQPSEATNEEAPRVRPSQIAVELRRARLKAGLSHSELHRATGISRTVLIGYEAGRTSPGGREMRKLCDALRVSPNQLVYGTEQPFQPDVALSRLGLNADALTFAHMMGLWNMLAGDDKRAFLTLMHSILEARHGREQLAQAAEIAAEIVKEFGEFLPLAMEKIGFSHEGMEKAVGSHMKELEAEARRRFARFTDTPQERPRSQGRRFKAR
jgi:transcriptional regulator with XRE-family HTH domain